MYRTICSGLVAIGVVTLVLLAPSYLVAQNLVSPLVPAASAPRAAAAAQAAPPAKIKPANAAVPGKPTKAAAATPAKTKPQVHKTTAARKKKEDKVAAAPKQHLHTKTAAAAPHRAAPPRHAVAATRGSATVVATHAAAPGAQNPVPVTRVAALPKPTTPPPALAEIKASVPAAIPAPLPPQAATPPAGAVPPAHQEAATPPAAPPARQATSPASVFLSAFLDKAFHIARDEHLTSLQRRAQLADLFGDKLDVSLIAGYTTADELTAEPNDLQRRFRTILVSYLVETYYPRLELASDPSVKVETVPGTPFSDGSSVVWTTFSKSGWGSQSVKWQLTPRDNGFKIVDIYSGGASLVQMERDTFMSVMRNGGLPELMAKLDARTKALASAATE